MHLRIKSFKVGEGWHWVIGFLAFVWVLLRSGTNPKRLTYPCQRAAIPIAANWFLAVIAFFIGSIFLRKYAKFCGLAILVAGVIWFAGALPELSESQPSPLASLPGWEVDDPVSTVFVIDSIPPTTGSLAAGDATVPDEYLPDPAIDTLLMMMQTRGVFFHETSDHPSGIVGADDIVIIKANFQWTTRLTTNTDRIKGLIWQILEHPEGFSGEIIVCDNTQDIGTGISDSDNNSEDPLQSILDVVSTFFAKGYPVYCLGWVNIWDAVVSEYSDGDYADGYLYDTTTKVSYPKFRSPSGNHYISLKHGIWDSLAAAYDPSRLCLIDFPVLKHHGRSGSTIAVKNWIGVLTTAHRDERYGGFEEMHNNYFFSPYALVSRVIEVTFPKLSIVDATWTTHLWTAHTMRFTNTKALVASIDPVAASWYSARFILTPIAHFPDQTNPDYPGGLYNVTLTNWTNFLRDSTEFACTNDSFEMSIYNRAVMGPCGDANADGEVNLSDVVYLINYILRSGPKPYPLDTGDVNCDVKVDIVDVVYLINYIFRGGPAPGDPNDDGIPDC
jgi:hypothetical protein